MSSVVTLLAKLLSKDLLVMYLKESIRNFEELPIDDNFIRLTMYCSLIAMKADADGQTVNELLEHLAQDTIPFFTASAN